MVLVGIDPGLASTGYGAVRLEGDRYRHLEHGCLRTRAEQDINHRLLRIHEAVAELILRHRPEALVLERLYELRDGSVGLSVGQAMGVVRLAAVTAGVPVVDYAPTHVKMTLVGNGQAAKHQVQYMVQRLLGLDAAPRPDHAADALALCVCHLHHIQARVPRIDGPPGPAAERIAAALAADEERRRAHRAREAGGAA